MNLIEEIKQQIEDIKFADNSIYLEAIRIHIERANYYYNEGKNDPSFFNDVIYRTNQAFEGALKEAYKILASKSDEDVIKETPHIIEKYLETNGIFKARVLELFKNYRQEWRNKSTHNYKLFFDENEAFIALINVSSFVHLLLKLLKEKIAFNAEQKRLESRRDKINKLIDIFDQEDTEFNQKVTELVIEFLTDNELLKNPELREYEVNGMLRAFLESSNNHLNINQQVNIGENLRPDFIVELEKSKLIVEVKKTSYAPSLDTSLNQLLTYLTFSKIANGILLIFQPGGESIQVHKKTYKGENTDYNITIVTNLNR